ncbi:MAG: serine hydrolase [Elusimicrobia bacterium]|nr:serine hydrolase [Elusimicrobiota bacterium]
MQARRSAALWALALALFSGCAAPARQGLKFERGARVSSYKWIDPLLDCESEDRPAELRHFGRNLDALAAQLVSRKDVTHVSIYFRDLRNGPWFGVNEDTKFLPASLLKVPMMVAVLDAAEDDPSLLSQTLTVPESDGLPLDPHYRPSEPMAPGSTRTVSELVSQMIRRSDNTAMAMLVQKVGVEGIHRLYDELGVLVPADGVPDELTVRDYASIFRILFNGSYLDRRYSERALEVLAQSEFSEGLAAPLPRSIPVAHKFGERRLGKLAEQQLHDCGIVYYPKVPYVLCVMTRGEDIDRLASAIRAVSGAVFEEVSKQYPAKF